MNKLQFGTKQLVYGVVLTLAVVVVLQALTPTVEAIDVSTLPEWLVPFVEAAQHFLTSTYLAVISGFGWSLFGFLRYYYGDQTVNYEVKRLVDTWLWYEGMLIVFTLGLPENYAVVLTTVIMALKSLLSKLKETT